MDIRSNISCILKPSVSDLHTNKSTLCMYTYIIMSTLYSHSAGLPTTNQTLLGRGMEYEVLNPGSLQNSNTLLPNKVIIVQIFIQNKSTRRLYTGQYAAYTIH